MRSGAEEALLKVLAKSIVDGEGDDKRSHAGSDADDGDGGDDTDDSLPSFGTEIARGDEEFELHANRLNHGGRCRG